MTEYELEMVRILSHLRQEMGVVAVKAEFEAEGTRVEELLRLLEVSNKAGLKIALKIGGCEAVRDLIESKSFGCDFIVAPMVETEYALQKFIEASEKIYSSGRGSTELLFNIETITSFSNKERLIESAAGALDGVVFGRVDYVSSAGLSRDQVNSKKVEIDVLQVADLCKRANLDFVVGGGVSNDAVPFLSSIAEIGLSRFETRKVIFSGESLTIPSLKDGLLQAVEFELLWLKNKREHYRIIQDEDLARINMLEERWGKF